MIDRGTQTEPMPTLRDDFTRIVQRAEDAAHQLGIVARDIDRLLRGPKPEKSSADAPNVKELGPQSISECLAAFVRAIGDVDMHTERLRQIRDDLAPANARGTGYPAPPAPTRDHPPFAEDPRRPSGERYG